MCGACGGPAAGDWAGALTASMPARIAVEGHRAWSDDPHDASDLVVAAEWARQSGAFDRTPFAARCPIDPSHVLDLEIRAGYVVRAVHQESPRTAR